MSYEIFWSFYWILVLFIIIISITSIIKKYYLTGITSLILSLVTPIYSFIFALSRDFTGKHSEGEIEFLRKQLEKGNLGAYFIIISYIILIGLTVYHIYKFIKKKK